MGCAYQIDATAGPKPLCGLTVEWSKKPIGPSAFRHYL